MYSVQRLAHASVRRAASAAAQAPRMTKLASQASVPFLRASYATEAAAASATESSESTTSSSSPPAAAAPTKKPYTAKQPASLPGHPSGNVPAELHYKPDIVAPLRNGGEGEQQVVAGANDWFGGFYGISQQPVSAQQGEKLLSPLDLGDIEVKPDGVIYLPEIKYRRRLNETFGPMGWGLIPRGDAIVGDSVVTREYALIVDGRFAAQAQGENTYFSPETLPNAVEGCKSNALMRCCKDLGIGSELWDPHFVRWFKKTLMESRWVEHATTKKKKQMWFRKGQVEVPYPFKLSGNGTK